MLLAIDVGNTHSVFAVFEGETLHFSWRISTDSHRAEDEYGALLLQLLAHRQLSAADIDGAILSSVVPDTVFPITCACEQYFGQTPLIVSAQTVKTDMVVAIDNPHELGADRLVNSIAALAKFAPPLIVVDFGTATTFDVVNAQREYSGGVIAPGVNLSLEALQKAAARLHGIRIRQPEQVIGRNTTAAMQSGIYFGYRHLVNGIIAEISAELAQAPTVIATGGLASLYARENPAIHHQEPDLTVHGLQLIYHQSRMN